MDRAFKVAEGVELGSDVEELDIISHFEIATVFGVFVKQDDLQNLFARRPCDVRLLCSLVDELVGGIIRYDQAKRSIRMTRPEAIEDLQT
jgi:hypothetical protein